MNFDTQNRPNYSVKSIGCITKFCAHVCFWKQHWIASTYPKWTKYEKIDLYNAFKKNHIDKSAHSKWVICF